MNIRALCCTGECQRKRKRPIESRLWPTDKEETKPFSESKTLCLCKIKNLKIPSARVTRRIGATVGGWLRNRKKSLQASDNFFLFLNHPQVNFRGGKRTIGKRRNCKSSSVRRTGWSRRQGIGKKPGRGTQKGDFNSSISFLCSSAWLFQHNKHRKKLEGHAKIVTDMMEAFIQQLKEQDTKHKDEMKKSRGELEESDQKHRGETKQDMEKYRKYPILFPFCVSAHYKRKEILNSQFHNVALLLFVNWIFCP